MNAKRTRSQLQVPPYFPEPEVVSGNIAGASYSTVLGFTRRVILANVLTSLAVAAIAMWFPLPVDLAFSVWLFLGTLLAMTVLRRMLRGGAPANIASGLLLVPTVISAGSILSELAQRDLPVVFLAAVPAGSVLYGLLCGRDFSFLGMFALGSMATLAVGIAIAMFGLVSWSFSMLGATLGVAGLAYFTYDLASILRRRRVGEEPAAAADLYRDLLNFLTYSVRVILHWRKFRFI